MDFLCANGVNNINNINLFANCDRYMLLKMKVTCSSSCSSCSNNCIDDLSNKYINAAVLHNEKMLTNPFPDAGFDLFSPTELKCFVESNNKINFQVQCQSTMMCENGKSYPTGFYMYPRSSTGSKTPLRLANSVGIIDSGYRGDLMSVFDCERSYVSESEQEYDYFIEKYSKLVQICAPGLVPIYVQMVDTLEDSERGSGGFGSTGV